MLSPNAAFYEKAVRDADAFASVVLPADKAEVNKLRDDIVLIKVCRTEVSPVPSVLRNCPT